LFNSKAKLGRLTSERDDLSSVVFDPALHDAAADDIRAAEAIINETAIFEARIADRRGEAAVLQSRIEGDTAVLQSKRAIDKSLSAEMSDLSELLADGYVDNRRLRELERVRTENLGQITDLEVSLEETGLRILQLQKRFKTEVVDALTRTREQFHDLQQQFLAIDDRVKRATIRAPVSGTAMNIGPNSVGAVIGSGQTLMEIVPELSRLVVEARISPMDIDAVAIGQSAEVRFAVFKDAYSVTGTLIKLSADRLVDEESQLPYYAAVVKLDEEDFYLLEGLTLIPGMPAEVLVKTGQRTFIGYLTSPLSRLFSRSLIED
jgi:epimerase transport system membrane fusion protein